MLPFEEDLGSHPDFERMRIHVAKEHKRPEFPINLKKSEASRVLKDTIEECWDTDAEARLTSLCVAERFKQLESLMEAKGQYWPMRAVRLPDSVIITDNLRLQFLPHWPRMKSVISTN